ncbi:conserved hypothetical protein [Candidatus Terasakiella magnetica]|uniref:Uncharacterized protein n=1 Tax=Candidatus Terasakiella magnetica TaxID=1867952 RepID=A0A1C3RHX3_9PROT|nr:hypothetical protein [Candidatus Terasakiella magnetica]SCA56814.1 conserved hypothetical protein [Candidatus Terasakiella magnetica]
MGSEELLLEAGKSGELTAVLHTMAESEIDGEAKFSPMICREIGKLVVCRTYATPLMELSHLIVAASELSFQKGRYEFFFWDSGVARSSSYQSYCHHAYADYNGSTLSLSENGLTLSYPDGEFSIQYSRMPVLSALLEFLLTALGYSDIDQVLQNLLSEELTRKSVSEAANTLSRQLYKYLGEHLPTAQSQRKFRKILAYCNDDVDSVDDPMILDFWQAASLEKEKGVDFKTYDSVLLTFVRAIQAVESARDLAAMRHAGSIGGDHEAGEIAPDLLSETLESVEETLSPLIELNSSPLNLVKFLNKQECANLEGLLNAGGLALRLPLSILRSDIFTKPQARLTQALRRHVEKNELDEIIDEGPQETYQERQITYQSMHKHIQKAIYASLHALAKARQKETVDVMLKLEPGIDFAPLAQHLIEESDEGSNVVTLQSTSITQHFIEIIHDEETVGPDIAKLMVDAEQAYNGFSRKGFKEDVSQAPELSLAFSQGADLLLDISRDIDAFLERLDNLSLAGGGWQSQFSYDRTVFSGQFSKIYGGF